MNNKKKGKKSEVYPFEVMDMKKMIRYFMEKQMWIHYLAFTLSCNMARRVSDMLSLKWKNFFHEDGDFRGDILEICEKKTDKLTNPHINKACRHAILKYIEETNCKPVPDDYVFVQLSGTHKGKVLSPDGFLKAIKKAAKEVGIEYNVGTHSTRKTFGMLSRMLHPNDYDSMEILQSVYNHSSTKTTKSYIGLTRQKINKYYNDMGNFYEEYIVGEKEYAINDKPTITLDSHDLRDIIKFAYESGRRNSDCHDSAHIDMVNSIMDMVDSLKK